MYRNSSVLSKRCDGKSVALTGKPQRKAMNSWKGSSQMLNRGSTSTASIWSHREVSGNWKIRRDRKNHREANQKSKHLDGFFFDCHGIMHHEFAPEGKNVNAVFYVEVLKRLKDHVRCMDWNCGRGGNGFSTTNMPHTLCINRAWVFGLQFHHRAWTSPLLARFSSLRFFVAPQVLRGRHLGDVTMIRSEITLAVEGLKRRGIPRVLPAMETEVGQCIVSNGEYFEWDHIDVS